MLTSKIYYVANFARLLMYIKDSYLAKFLRLEEYKKYIVSDIAVDHLNKYNKNLRSMYWP